MTAHGKRLSELDLQELDLRRLIDSSYATPTVAERLAVLEKIDKIQIERASIERAFDDHDEYELTQDGKSGALQQAAEIVPQSPLTQSQAGAIGGDRRSAHYEPLRRWVREEAPKEKGAEMDIARRLAGRLPDCLRDLSADPERYIYDLLREAREKRQTSSE